MLFWQDQSTVEAQAVPAPCRVLETKQRLTEKYCSASNWSCSSFIWPSASCLSLQPKTNLLTFHRTNDGTCVKVVKPKNKKTNGLAQFLVLFLQAALNVQQVIHFLLQLLLGGPQGAELLVLSLQVVLRQAALLGLLLDFQRHVLHLRGKRQRAKSIMFLWLLNVSFHRSRRRRLTSSVNWSLCRRSSSSFCKACL